MFLSRANIGTQQTKIAWVLGHDLYGRVGQARRSAGQSGHARVVCSVCTTARQGVSTVRVWLGARARPVCALLGVLMLGHGLLGQVRATVQPVLGRVLFTFYFILFYFLFFSKLKLN